MTTSIQTETDNCWTLGQPAQPLKVWLMLISKFYVSDSIPQEENIKLCPKLEIFTISDLMADVIKRIITKKPISELFVY